MPRHLVGHHPHPSRDYDDWTPERVGKVGTYIATEGAARLGECYP